MRRPATVGVDVGGSKVLAVVVDADLRVLGQHLLPAGRGVDAVVATVVRAVLGCLSAASLTLDDVQVVGVGVPGLVRPGSGRVSHAVNLDLGTGGVDLATRLAVVLGIHVVVENDVNAAALGAASIPPGHRDMALLSIGTGLAAGIVVDGMLHRGSRGAAGEIGHVQIDPAGPPCRCGQRGCLEMVASGSALARSWSSCEGPAGAALWAAASRGEAAAVRARDDFTRGVAAAVRLLVLTWDVERVVLSGGVVELGDALLAQVRVELATQGRISRLLQALDLPGRVELLPAGTSAGAVGAAVAARQSLPPRVPVPAGPLPARPVPAVSRTSGRLL